MGDFFNSDEPLRAVYVHGIWSDIMKEVMEKVSDRFNIQKDHTLALGGGIVCHCGPRTFGFALQPFIE